LENINNQKLGLDKNAYDFTKKIIYKETAPNGWKVYGKTGTGHPQKFFGKSKITDKQMGWFVGWIEKSHRKIYIVNFIEKNFSGTYDAGLESYNQVMDYVRGI